MIELTGQRALVTGGNRGMNSPALARGNRERIERSIPLQRLATVEDIAGAIHAFCST